MLLAVCRCTDCKALWTSWAVDEPDINIITLVGELQSCPDCGSVDYTIIDQEYPEPSQDDIA